MAVSIVQHPDTLTCFECKAELAIVTRLERAMSILLSHENANILCLASNMWYVNISVSCDGIAMLSMNSMFHDDSATTEISLCALMKCVSSPASSEQSCDSHVFEGDAFPATLLCSRMCFSMHLRCT